MLTRRLLILLLLILTYGVLNGEDRNFSSDENPESTGRILLLPDSSGEYAVAEESGKVLMELENRVVQEYFDLPVSGRLRGWSSNQKHAWIECSVDGYVAGFLVLDLENRAYDIFRRPENFQSGIQIDFDTGTAYYSDYPLPYDIEIAIERDKSGRVFSLYKYNFFSREEEIVDSNKGEGFYVFKDAAGKIQYEKMNNYRIGKLNDSRVRIRARPDLESDTIGYLSKGQVVDIIDVSDQQMIIGEMSAFWYKILTSDYSAGWVYGYFIDIQDRL